MPWVQEDITVVYMSQLLSCDYLEGFLSKI